MLLFKYKRVLSQVAFITLVIVLAEFGTEDMDTGAEADSSTAKVAKANILSLIIYLAIFLKIE